MTKYSILDLSPIPEGGTAADALANSTDLARHAESLGFHRYWLAEHHNSPGIASAATAVVIGHIAAATASIRVGAGGIMLPNHAPLVVAEQFGTLATLHPERIDLGLGRAPGTDMNTARALRRGMSGTDHFPEDVVELIGFLQPAAPDQPVRAVPGEGTRVPVWILGSSLFGAQLAAKLGLPYAFASHFAPDALDEAVTIYRRYFQPGLTDNPRFMLAVNVFAAETETEAQHLQTSMQQGFLNLRRGHPAPLPAPIKHLSDIATPAELRMVNHALRISAVGTPDIVRDRLCTLMERYHPDEIIMNGMIHDHTARKRSFEIAASVMKDLNGA